LRARRIDILHTRLVRADFVGRLAGRLAGVPLIVSNLSGVYSRHFPSWHRGVAGRVLAALDRASLPLTHVFVANAEAVRADFLASTNIPRDRVHRIHNGVDPAPFDRARPERPCVRNANRVGDDRCVVGFVGRLFRDKGLATLVEAMAELSRSVPRPLALWIVGDGPERASLEALVAARHLAGTTCFAGLRDDVPRWLTGMDVFAFPSTHEGNPNAVLEAMCASLPVVAAGVPGTAEVVGDGETGLLVPPGDAGAMASALRTLILDPARAAAYGEAGRERVLGGFSMERMVEEFGTLYERELARRLSRSATAGGVG
jgi:glycosyltransferase involved in cell wall biosynthesis